MFGAFGADIVEFIESGVDLPNGTYVHSVSSGMWSDGYYSDALTLSNLHPLCFL